MGECVAERKKKETAETGKRVLQPRGDVVRSSTRDDQTCDRLCTKVIRYTPCLSPNVSANVQRRFLRSLLHSSHTKTIVVLLLPAGFSLPLLLFHPRKVLSFNIFNSCNSIKEGKNQLQWHFHYEWEAGNSVRSRMQTQIQMEIGCFFRFRVPLTAATLQFARGANSINSPSHISEANKKKRGNNQEDKTSDVPCPDLCIIESAEAVAVVIIIVENRIHFNRK